jgi:NTP pyrophosphatase (non-canonical NTP hydrolase)
MEINEYQENAKLTSVYPKEYSIIYPTIGLAGECGEVCEKIKKQIRDKNSDFLNEVFKKDIIKELGDVLWYVAILASDLNITMEEIAYTNILKLNERKNNNKINGNGDNR